MFRIHPRQNSFDLSITGHFLEVHMSEDNETCSYCRCDITRGQGVKRSVDLIFPYLSQRDGSRPIPMWLMLCRWLACLASGLLFGKSGPSLARFIFPHSTLGAGHAALSTSETEMECIATHQSNLVFV